MHWNFFFTLGLLPILGALLENLSPTIDFTLMALLISLSTLFCSGSASLYEAGHQALLDFTTLQEWTLHTARVGLVSMNKEGIVSLPGTFFVTPAELTG